MSWKNDQVSEKETQYIIGKARECLGAIGDFVELGCYKGDTSLLLAEIVQHGAKCLWIYDSFEGLPEKSDEDNSPLGEDFKKGELVVTKREVKERFLRAGLKVPVIKKGWFKDFSLEDLPAKIAFCFLDGDFYESIRDGLRLIQGKMSESSILIIHDYNNLALPGVKRAVDEWFSNLSGYNVATETCESMLVIEFSIKN